MSTLEDLGLTDNEPAIEIPDDIPEESSGYIALPQPGEFLFQLPDDVATTWSKFDIEGKGARISVGFTRDNPLTILGEGKNTHYDGYFNDSPVITFINNNEWPRGREKVLVSDMTYLIKALEATVPDGEKSKLTNNVSYVKALEKHLGKQFYAEVSWRAYCNPNKDIYMRITDADGNTRVEQQPGTPGCGANYTSYARDFTKRIPVWREEEEGCVVPGWFKERFEEIEVHQQEDGCPASLICSVQLSRFRTAEK